MTARRSDLAALFIMAASAMGIASVQSTLTAAVKHVRLTDDGVALPPPRQLRAMSLGYRSALADLLWAKLLVEQGVRREEKRTFDGVTRYLDGIIELEPDHQTLYEFVDTLLIYPPSRVGTEADARRARAYMESGTRERPYDHDLWLHYGQFIAFLAPSYLEDKDEIERWRKDGALAIAHAVELGANADSRLSAATILTKAGETKAAIQHLQNRYALTEDPDEREQISLKLGSLKATVGLAAAVEVVEGQRRQRYPFLTKGQTLLVGPYRDAARCAGPDSYQTGTCAADWSEAARQAP